MVIGNWPEVRLGDLIKIKHGWPFQSKFFTDDQARKPIVVNIGNFQYSGGFRFEQTALKGYLGDYPAEYTLKPGDILLIMTCQTAGGEILGIPGRIPDDGRIYLHNQRLGKVDILVPAKVDAGFLYWLFRSSGFNRELAATASGTKILHTSPGRIEAYRFRLPSLPEQRAIASILGSLDDKIELNQRMNATLEEMARAIFHAWFVDFEPVRAKAEGRTPQSADDATAALFPDAFEVVEGREVPRGWDVSAFDTIIELIGGGTPRTTEPEYWGGEIPWFSVVDAPADSDVFVLKTEKTITQRGLAESSARILPVGTSIISARGTVGKCALVGTPMAMNQSCYGVRGKDDRGAYFTYFSLRLMVDDLRRMTHGAVFDTITRDTFKVAKMVIPPVELSKCFDKATDTLLAHIRSNQIQFQTLVTLRDALLTKLLSGELRVHEAERLVEEQL